MGIYYGNMSSRDWLRIQKRTFQQKCPLVSSYVWLTVAVKDRVFNDNVVNFFDCL